MFDLELLARSNIAFVGSAMSTFSELAAARAVYATLQTTGALIDVRLRDSMHEEVASCREMYANASQPREEGTMSPSFRQYAWNASLQCPPLTSQQAYEQAADVSRRQSST